MDTTIMLEWLPAVYRHVGTVRKILLTMDNFGPHLCGVRILPPPPNIRILWFPANSTSLYQPLDQAIIASVKAGYKRQWLSYMLECATAEQDPMKTMNVYLAIRWSLRSWNNHLTSETVANCYRKSTLVKGPMVDAAPIVPPDMAELFEQVIQATNIRDSMAIANFLNPAEEDVNIVETGQTNDELLEEVVNEHLGIQTVSNDEDEEVQFVKPSRTMQEAQDAIKILFEYMEGQDELQVEYLRALERLEAALEKLRVSSQTQSTLDR
jgi:hypothetical protein